MSHIHTTEKFPGATNSKGRHTNTTGATFCNDGAIQQAQDRKVTATLIAQLALAGHAVHKAQDGGFIVTKWGQTRYCANSAELAAFARKLGVNHD